MNPSPQSRRENSSLDESRIKRFLEELSWLLCSNSNLDFKSLPRQMKAILEDQSNRKAIGGYVSSNPNKHYLVGVLPRLLNDTALFNTNDEIADFALSVMGVSIPRYHKKSRYELIGHIVCETEFLDDERLRDLAKALDVLIKQGERMREYILIRRQGAFGWNEVIQDLARAEHE